ncbi:MAG: hypothetical protein DI585_00380 [Pseudomonas fluorescens]|nr:MAG: hypothetical protein DI585_00380 [Pseudomonas fluorescens]
MNISVNPFALLLSQPSFYGSFKSKTRRKQKLEKQAQDDVTVTARQPRKRLPKVAAAPKGVVYDTQWQKDFVAGRCVDGQGQSYTDYLLEIMAPAAVVSLLYVQLTAPEFRAWARQEQARHGFFFTIPAHMLADRRKPTSASAMRDHKDSHPITMEKVNIYAKPKDRNPKPKTPEAQQAAAHAASVAETVPSALDLDVRLESTPRLETVSGTVKLAALQSKARESRLDIFGEPDVPSLRALELAE